jgi:hypothetical protein
MVFVDANSFACNTLIGAGVSVGSLGGFFIVRGFLGTILGLKLLRDGLAAVYNGRNVIDNSLRAYFGANYALISCFMLTNQIATYAGHAAAMTVCAAALPILVPLFYGSLAVWSGYGICIQLSFRSKLLKIKKEQGEEAAFNWLKKEVAGDSREELKKNWDQFAYRTSEAACRLVREADPKTPAEFTFILEEVEKAANKKLMNHAIYFSIAMIGLTAAAVSFATGGAGFPFLLAGSAALFVFVDWSYLNTRMTDRVFGPSRIPPAEVPKTTRIAFPILHGSTVPLASQAAI